MEDIHEENIIKLYYVNNFSNNTNTYCKPILETEMQENAIAKPKLKI